MLGDRKSETGAPIPPGRRTVALCERFEYMPALLRRNAYPRVDNFEGNQDRSFVVFHRVGADADLSTLGKLDRIADQIRQNLPQSSGVADQIGLQNCRDKAGELKPLAVSQFTEQLRDLFDNDPKIELAIFDVDPAGLYLG
jgi:hypothetical protein